MSQSDTKPRPPSLRQVALGLFILFQLAFLVFGNLIGYVGSGPPESKDRPKQVINRLAPDLAESRGHAHHFLDEINTFSRHWMELTGQDQGWALFCSPGPATGFPAVLMLWDDDPSDDALLPGALLASHAVDGFDLWADWNPATPRIAVSLAVNLSMFAASNPLEVASLHFVHKTQPIAAPRLEFLLSENEPRDIQDFTRFGNARLRRYEGQLYVSTEPDSEETREVRAGRLTREMQRLVRDYDETALAYLRFRMMVWLREHPDAPKPRQVVLLHRSYRIRGPDVPRGWDGPWLVPCARWLPDSQPNPRFFRMEPFDFVNQRFDRLAR